MPGLGLAVNRTRVTIFQLQALVFILLFGLVGVSPVRASFTVGNGSHSATYSYAPQGSGLVSQIAFNQGTTTRLTTTKEHDFLNRLRSVVSLPSGGNEPLLGFGYEHNAANQRRRATMPDGSYWEYEYDGLGQLASGKKHWADGTLVAGQQYEYAHDSIGNRRQVREGGNESGNPAALSVSNYSIDAVNQIDERTNSDRIEVIGVADPAATVKVNGDPGVYRRGEYFRKELAVANNSYPTVTVTADSGGQQSLEDGEVFVPPATESFVYDDDGNVLYDGRWEYTWDAENQLIAMESVSPAPTGSERRLEFDYDYLGRRIGKRVYVNGAGTPAVDLKFVYDGWNLIAELNETDNSLVRGYIWGLDLSGSLQGAGGTGGLLAVVDATEGTHFAVLDGSGNVAGLVDADTGVRSATYEYDPFGQTIRATGPAADLNPFRFSTRYADVESGMLYYGYRYYNPSTGRWLNRDPIGEAGGVNLYSFVRNRPVNSFDPLGLAEIFCRAEDGKTKRVRNASVDDLLKLLEEAAKSGNLIDDLRIKDHGSEELMSFSKDTFLITTVDKKIIDDKGRDLTGTFKMGLTPNAMVCLNGCKTGRGDDNIAKEMSEILPGKTVAGGAGIAQLNVPFTSSAIGKKNYFIDGKKWHSEW